MSFILTGQTDSGKSTISGNLLYNVGYFFSLPEEDRKCYRKYLEQINDTNIKSRYSILMDLLDGEILTNKTKTQEFNVCTFTYNEKTYKLIDTPGHKLYIRSLIDGLFHQKLDRICLVVSSLSNEFYESFERGTIKEDLMLSRSTGCSSLLIIWNKSDISKPDEKMLKLLMSFVKKLSFKVIDEVYISAYDPEQVLKILSYINSNEVIKPIESLPIISDMINTDGMLFTDKLISAGYKFIIHYLEGEIEAEIIKIKNLKTQAMVRFVKEPTLVRLMLKISESKKWNKGERLIYRDSETTLGFGTIN